MAEQDLDRTEAATPHKLLKARERGQVAKSAEVASTLVFTVGATLLYWKGWEQLQVQFSYAHKILLSAGQSYADDPTAWAVVSEQVTHASAAIAPFLAILMGAAILANLLQTGLILSVEPLKADLKRLNPLQGLKKLFTARTIYDGVRAVLKLSLLALVAYQVLMGLRQKFPSLATMPTALLTQTVLEDIARAGLKMALLLWGIAAVDYVFTQREFAKTMRMSKRDLKDEHKAREGDPRVRNRLRALRLEALRRSMGVLQTARADVLVTNPTHIAVALRYVHEKMDSPQLVAKGAGKLAAAMREIAARHQIPVVQNRSLARQLFHETDVDQQVPQQLYAQVAKILVWVFAMRSMHAGRTAA